MIIVSGHRLHTQHEQQASSYSKRAGAGKKKAAAAAVDAPQANMSKTSAGEDAAAVVQPQRPPQSQHGALVVGETPRLWASFFERLVRRFMEHQEGLHRQFLDAMERRERERAARDEA